MQIIKSLLLFIILASTGYLHGQQPVVKTKSGPITGMTNPDGDIRIFKGIPFAAPPVGPLRWQPPQPVQKWKGVKECTAFSPRHCRKRRQLRRAGFADAYGS